MQNRNKPILILAGGSSSRLGGAKQLLKHNGESLLKIITKKALILSNDVFVVLGDSSKECEEELREFNITTVFNKNYTQGLGTSLAFGVVHVSEFKNVLVLLCDQPFMSLYHLEKLKI